MPTQKVDKNKTRFQITTGKPENAFAVAQYSADNDR